LAVLAAATLGKLSGSGQQGEWGERALQWMTARDHAAHRSVAELVMFKSFDTVDVLCCGQGGPPRGRVDDAGWLASRFGDALEEQTMGRSYVDVSGDVVEYGFQAGLHDDLPARGGEPVDANELQVSQHDASGAVAEMLHPMSLKPLQSLGGDARQWFGEDLGAQRSLASRYLSAWSGRDGAAVSGLYAPNATVLDSLLGARLTGRDAIGSYAVQHGGARLRLDEIPDDGGPALYGFWREYGSPVTMYLTYTGDDGSGCPGGVAAALQIEHGQIVAERRYHDVTSMRRCFNTEQLPDGWWTHAVIPAPIQDKVTATVTAAGRRVEIHNGTPGAEDLVRWAMERFPAADLPAPQLAFVAVSEDVHRDQCAGDRWGLALPGASSASIYLCFTVEGAPTPFQREMTLHELAHAWMWQNLTGTTRQQFLAQMHLATWDAGGTPWEKRGIEYAADVIAWGLADGPITSRLTAGRSCTELTEAFRILTQATPLQPCSAKR
jgi:hypothetical protein